MMSLEEFINQYWEGAGIDPPNADLWVVIPDNSEQSGWRMLRSVNKADINAIRELFNNYNFVSGENQGIEQARIDLLRQNVKLQTSFNNVISLFSNFDDLPAGLTTERAEEILRAILTETSIPVTPVVRARLLAACEHVGVDEDDYLSSMLDITRPNPAYKGPSKK